MPDPVDILMVDDRPENLAALNAILNSPDYHLIAVTSGLGVVTLGVALFAIDWNGTEQGGVVIGAGANGPWARGAF